MRGFSSSVIACSISTVDLHRAINEHVYECRALIVRLESNEQDKVTEVDLVVLRAQLFLLDVAAADLQKLKRLQHMGEGP